MEHIKIFKNGRIILLLVFLFFSVLAIAPAPWNEGVIVRSVASNSSAADAGIQNPLPNTPPLSYEKIISIDNIKINSAEDYYLITASIGPNQTVRIVTSEAVYLLKTRPVQDPLGSVSGGIADEVSNSTGGGFVDLGLKVGAAPKSNLRRGLDLAGGSRVLLSPDDPVTDQDLETIIESLTQRLNVYGLSDIVVRDAVDLSGNKFILVEIAGVTEEEIQKIIASQGKFEAKIGNGTVFVGGNKDITHVCRTADCSGLNPQSPCAAVSEGGWICGFFFQISLSPSAAQRQADATKNLEVIVDGSQRYLEHPLDLYLDDKLVSSLQIHASLKGQAESSVQISGSGSGSNAQEAASNSLEEMKRLQTVLKTGSLPVKLSVVKMDTVSPILGERFAKNILLVAVSALFAVSLVIMLRYRSVKVVVPMVIAMLSEIVLILGFAAIIGWNLDIASMAGIIITIGTAVDHLIVITDETLRSGHIYDWKRKLKNAMFIIFGAYLTVVAGMLPLWFAGAGLLKGFAFTTIAGVSFGVFIARPAYAALLKILVNE